MVDINKCINIDGDLQNFCLENDLIDTVGLFNPTQTSDATYLYGKKYIHYIFIIPALSLMAVKAGHHQLYQHFVSDYKGVYLQFLAWDLFNSKLMDRSRESY